MRRLLLALVAVLLGAAPSWAAVAFDAVGTAQAGASGTSANIPITLGSGPNTAVVVGFTGGADTTGVTCTMNAGAETLTIISGTDGGGTTGTVQLGKSTSLSGAQTVACSWTTNQSYGVNALSFTGVSPAEPFNNGTFTSGATPLGISVTSTSGDLTTTVTEEGVGVSLTTNQTGEWVVNSSAGSKRAGDIGAGSGTTTHTWTASSGTIFGSGANIRQTHVAFDAVGTAQSGNSGTSASIPITIGTFASRAVVVGFSGGNDTVGMTCTMNSGAETLTVVSGSDGGGTTGTVILGKATALSGAQTVACSWTNSQNYSMNALSFTGVDPTTPFNHGTFGTGAPPFNLAVTSTSGDLTTTVNGTDNGSAPTSNQTQKWTQTHAGGDIGPGTGNTTHIWSGGTLEFASGVNVVKVQPVTSGLFRSQGDLTGVGTGGKFHKDPLQ